MGVILIILACISIGVLVIVNKYHKKYIHWYELGALVFIIATIIGLQYWVKQGMSEGHYRLDTIHAGSPDIVFQID